MNRNKIAMGVGIVAALGGALTYFRKSPMLTADPRQEIVKAALTQLGPQDPDKYWGVVQPQLMGNPTGISWCGGFALWALQQAGIAKDMIWHVGRGFAEVYGLPKTSDPKPGDIAYFDQPYQHHAIVKEVVGNTLYTIDGNQAGETVKERTRNKSEATAFYSIERLV